jgi:hypothetical protein
MECVHFVEARADDVDDVIDGDGCLGNVCCQHNLSRDGERGSSIKCEKGVKQGWKEFILLKPGSMT